MIYTPGLPEFTLLFPMILTSLALFALQTGYPPPFDVDSGRSIPFSSTAWPGGTVTRMLPGDFLGSHYRDLVVLEDDDLTLSFGPAVFTDRTMLASGVSDACSLPGAGLDGADALFAANAAGWATIWIDNSVNPAVQLSATADPEWVGAWSIARLEGGSGAPAIAALNAAGTKILLVTDPMGAAVSSQITNLPGLARALCAVDIDGNGVSEIGLLHESGVQLWSPAVPSGPLGGFGFGGGIVSGSLAAFRQSPGAAERVAVVFERSNGQSDLRVVDLVSSENLALAYGQPPIAYGSSYAVAAGWWEWLPSRALRSMQASRRSGCRTAKVDTP